MAQPGSTVMSKPPYGINSTNLNNNVICTGFIPRLPLGTLLPKGFKLILHWNHSLLIVSRSSVVPRQQFQDKPSGLMSQRLPDLPEKLSGDLMHRKEAVWNSIVQAPFFQRRANRPELPSRSCVHLQTMVGHQQIWHIFYTIDIRIFLDLCICCCIYHILFSYLLGSSVYAYIIFCIPLKLNPSFNYSQNICVY